METLNLYEVTSHLHPQGLEFRVSGRKELLYLIQWPRDSLMFPASPRTLAQRVYPKDMKDDGTIMESRSYTLNPKLQT